MPFKSKRPDVDFPQKLTIWEWAFEDKGYSPLYRYPTDEIASFINGSTGERLSYWDIREQATYLSTALTKRYGLMPGDVVSLFSQNNVWYPCTMFAVLRVGGRVNGASPAYNVDEMKHALKVAKTKYLFTVPGSIEVALAASKDTQVFKKNIFLLEGHLAGYTTLQELLQIGRSYSVSEQAPVFQMPAQQNQTGLCAFLNFSSGTTGLPKAVMISHQNVIAQCHQLKDMSDPGRKKFLAQIPLFHISGLVRFLNWPVFSNNDCIMLPSFTMESFLDAIVKYQVEDLTLVPPLVIRLIQDPVVAKYDLSCVKRLSCGAAPLSEEVILQIQKKMPWTGFRQGYGLTETTGCIATHPPEYYDYKYANTGGVLCPSTIIKVIDVETGKELGLHQAGEILVKGPQVTMGYLDSPQETAVCFDADGYLHTGDVGTIDEEGFVRIVDRIKELIKVKGLQVAPTELEGLLLGHSDVADCAVVGILDIYSGERPKAFIVLKPGTVPSEAIGKALISYVQKNRVQYKWIKEVEFMEVIPKNSSGKILRRFLRQRKRSEVSGLVIRDNGLIAKI